MLRRSSSNCHFYARHRQRGKPRILRIVLARVSSGEDILLARFGRILARCRPSGSSNEQAPCSATRWYESSITAGRGQLRYRHISGSWSARDSGETGERTLWSREGECMCPTSAASQAPRKAVLKSRDWLRGSYAGSHSAVLQMNSAFWAFATWQICTSAGGLGAGRG